MLLVEEQSYKGTVVILVLVWEKNNKMYSRISFPAWEQANVDCT